MDRTASARTRLADSLASISRRISMGDVDAAGILYFAAPYPWLEDAFTGWLKQCGHPLSSLLSNGFGCPCVTSATSYHVPLVLDDELSVSLNASSIGRTSFSITIEARRVGDQTVAVRSTAWHVWSEFDGYAVPPAIRPATLPKWLDNALRAARLVAPVQTTAPC